MSLMTAASKIAVIDRETYLVRKEGLQFDKEFCNLNCPKKHQLSFNLLHFISKRQKVTKKLKQRHGIKINYLAVPKQKKSFRSGKKKKQSKLKRSVLQFRRKKILEDDVKISTLLSTLKIEEVRNPQNIHSRNFREYCDNLTTPELNQLTKKILWELDHFQKRAVSQNPIKARSHRRICVGFRELQNYLRINKVKLAVIATDCEKCDGDDGLDETINRIKTQCVEQNVLCMFALRRRQLAYTLFKKVPVSCVGILNYEGSQDLFHQLVQTLEQARKLYYSKTL